MSILVDLKPEVQEKLSRQAAAQGIDVGAYAANVLEEAVVSAGRKSRSQEKLDEALEEIAQFSHKIPLLPDEALSRQGFYLDHD
ncbi:MAG: hypothetical protein WBY44_32960 [Bryobacteraceae bacterium]|jgi:hypothetical protein